MMTPRRAIPPAVWSLLACLADHLRDRFQGPLRVIFRGGALPGVPFVSVLEIGQPDIDDAVEQADHLGLLVPPAVVDERQLKAPLAGRKQRFQDGGELRRGRHQLDVVAALHGELQHGARQGLPVHRFPHPVTADPVILAEGALQVAGGEKEGACARRPGDGRFLAEVGQGPRKDGAWAETAKPRFPLEPVDPALPGTQGAAAHELPQKGDALLQGFYHGSRFLQLFNNSRIQCAL